MRERKGKREWGTAICILAFLCIGALGSLSAEGKEGFPQCPYYPIVAMGEGRAGATYLYHMVRYGPQPPPPILVLDTGMAPDPSVAPFTAPTPPYSIGQPQTRYTYTTPQNDTTAPPGVYLIHLAEVYAGGAASIGEGIEAGPSDEALDNWAADGATGWDAATLHAYHRFAENCTNCASNRTNRGHDGAVEYVSFWERRGPYEELLQNASTVFGVPVEQSINDIPGVIVGDQTGVLDPTTGFVVRHNSVAKWEELAAQYPGRIKVLHNATVTRWELDRGPWSRDYRVGTIHYDHNGEGHCVCAGWALNGMGWLRTVEVAKRSGIGPADELGSLGIPVKLDRPSLGIFEGDAQTFTMQWVDTDPNRANATWLPTAVFSSSGSYGDGVIDAEFPMIVVPATLTGGPAPVIISPLYISTVVYQGDITLRSPSAASQSAIDIHLGLGIDSPMLQTVDYMVRKARELMALDPSFIEIFPGGALPGNYTLDQLLALMKSSTQTGPQPHHLHSAPIPDIVYPSGQWRGIRNLWSMGSMDALPSLSGHPHWLIVAGSTKLGCEQAERLGGPGCGVRESTVEGAGDRSYLPMLEIQE